MKMVAPFNEAQIEALNMHQLDGRVHPYTCDRKSPNCEAKSMPRDYAKDGRLIATKDGWICPCGKYKQSWAHAD